MTRETAGGPEKQSVSFRVPRWCPPSLNPFMGRHFSAVHRIKRQLADLLGVYARAAGLAPVSLTHRPRRRVRLTVIGWHEGSPMPDPDNLLKLFLDACVRARILVDDSKQWCRWERPVLQRGTPDESIVTVDDLRFYPPCTAEQDPQTRRMLAALTRKLNAAPKRKPGHG